jgi:hypothetical protein
VIQLGLESRLLVAVNAPLEEVLGEAVVLGWILDELLRGLRVLVPKLVEVDLERVRVEGRLTGDEIIEVPLIVLKL